MILATPAGKRIFGMMEREIPRVWGISSNNPTFASSSIGTAGIGHIGDKRAVDTSK